MYYCHIDTWEYIYEEILPLSIDFRKCKGSFDFQTMGCLDLEHDRKLKFSTV